MDSIKYDGFLFGNGLMINFFEASGMMVGT